MTRQDASITAFVGPSLRRRSPSFSGIEFRPPAQKGDLAAVVGKYQIAVLIDGAFFQVPSVTHREILDAMRSGLVVIGAASMGALRAVELERHGMIGIGTVFEAVRDSIIVDDSELAVAMKADTFEASTIPLVNVRRFLAIAATHGVSEDALRRAWQAAYEIHFLERSAEALMDAWSGVALPDVCRLYSTLDPSEADVKSDDAVHALDFAMAWKESPVPVPRRAALTLVDFSVPCLAWQHEETN